MHAGVTGASQQVLNQTGIKGLVAQINPSFTWLTVLFLSGKEQSSHTGTLLQLALPDFDIFWRTPLCARTGIFVLNAPQGTPLSTICQTGALNSYKLEDPKQLVTASRTHRLEDLEQHLPPYFRTALRWFNFEFSFFCSIRKSSFFRLPHSPLALLSISLLNTQIKSISVIFHISYAIIH